LVGVGLLLSLFSLQAQETAVGFPARPVRVISTFPADGGVDVIARVVDNKPGAGGITAAYMVAESAADGFTLLFALGTVLTVDNTPKQFTNVIDSGKKKWGEVIRLKDIKADLDRLS
jgi:tripartite-type tricarboxylate transporter receptor subunit TctC